LTILALYEGRMYCSCAGSAAWPVKKENETALVVYHAELQMVRQK